MSNEFFLDILQDSLRSSKVVVIFVEEMLCSEDISSRDIKGTPYLNLHEGLLTERVRYFPAVRNPYKSLKQIFANHNTNVFHVSNMDKLKMYDSRNSHYYIYFEDTLNETRIETLRRHDLIIKEIYHAVRNYATGPVLGFYTGKNNPMLGKEIKVLPLKRNIISSDTGVSVESNDALFHFVGVYSSSAKRQSRFSQAPVVADERLTRRHLSTKVAYTDFELEFNFSFKKDGWIIDDVALLEGGEEVGRTRMCAGAPWEHSYVCGEPLVIINLRDGSAVTISFYQIVSAFDLRKNASDLMSVSKDEIKVMHGVRFLTAFMVVTLHVMFINIMATAGNGLDMNDDFKRYAGFLSHSSVVVDTYFMMSGLLLMRSFKPETGRLIREWTYRKRKYPLTVRPPSVELRFNADIFGNFSENVLNFRLGFCPNPGKNGPAIL
ncbi:hypothetical protein RR46_00434 [Papilio xuthus]|uniref:Uncharacterized protein n=1 Tax=Papilio xuthus TaxID=66420 RepID=A0A0N1I2M0_PAPXU|nr:hypothetical protein RR46_00434 [Papilio xuthus]